MDYATELQGLLRDVPGNGRCADCRSEEPSWAVINLGIFVCVECSGIHRNLGTHISKVRSVVLDKWNDDLMEMVRVIGNKKSNEKYEKCVPFTYKIPTFDDPYILREQWIRAKYDRKEFIDEESLPEYLSGKYSGPLLKKGKRKDKWLERTFRVSDDLSTLKYYIHATDETPKQSLPIKDTHVYLASVTGRPHSLRIRCNDRDLFVASDDGKDIAIWLNVIRACRAKALGLTAPTTPEEISEISWKMSHPFVIEGYIEKMNAQKKWQRRWFAVDRNCITYCDRPLDYTFKGTITFTKDVKILRGRDDDCDFHIVDTSRTYNCRTISSKNRDEWISKLRSVTELI